MTDRSVSCLCPCQNRSRLSYSVIWNSTEEDRWGMEIRGVLYFDGFQRLACRTIPASAEILVISIRKLICASVPLCTVGVSSVMCVDEWYLLICTRLCYDDLIAVWPKTTIIGLNICNCWLVDLYHYVSCIDCCVGGFH